MKRRILIKKLEAAGWYLLRNGSNHDLYIPTNLEKIDINKKRKE